MLTNNGVRIRIVSNKAVLPFKEQMWEIYACFYDYTKQAFYDRLKKIPKHALYLYGNRVVGFTGIYLGEGAFKEKNIKLLGLGSTVILPEFRGRYLLQRTCLKLRWDIFIQSPWEEVYFWCHASSFKTYCILARFRTHHPSYRASLSLPYKNLIDYIGKITFGKEYDSLSGTARFKGITVKGTNNLIAKRQLQDSTIRFFYEKIKSVRAQSNEVNGLITVAPMNFSNIWGWILDAVFDHRRKRL